MAPLLRSRSVQLTALAALLLLAGPVMQLLHAERRAGHVTQRGRLRDPQKLGMGAFVGDTVQHAHVVSAVQAWQEAEAKRAAAAGAAQVKTGQSADAAAALQAAVSAHAELDRLHMQQREMIELHLAAGQHGDDAALAAEAEAELWAKAEIEDYVAHHRKQKQPSEGGGADGTAAAGGGGGGGGGGSGATALRRRLHVA